MIPVYKPWITDLEKHYVRQAIESEWISSQGEFIGRFESAFAAKFGFKHAIAVNTGTAALHLALLAGGVKPRDKVIVPDLTFVATANAVKYCGAEPIFVDVELDTYNMDIWSTSNIIESGHASTIVPVHLYGSPFDCDNLLTNRSYTVIDDACEALGATCGPSYVGHKSKVACFSFFGNKTITTGEGGMVVTNDKEIADYIRLLKGQGQGDRQYYHPVIGYNYRMTNVQAAIGLAQLERWDQIYAEKTRVYQYYLENIDRSKLWPQYSEAHCTHGYWMYAGQADTQLRPYLKSKGIDTRPSFVPMHTLPPYKDCEFISKRILNKTIVDSSDDTSVSEFLSKRIIILPSYPTLTNEELKYICHTINDFQAH